jgi:hypothetical protein
LLSLLATRCREIAALKQVDSEIAAAMLRMASDFEARAEIEQQLETAIGERATTTIRDQLSKSSERESPLKFAAADSISLARTKSAIATSRSQDLSANSRQRSALSRRASTVLA